MIRIQCDCGKFLKVGDSLLGKRIKCPGCGAAQLVQATSDVDEPAAPAAAVKRTGPGPITARKPPPKPRPGEADHLDERPRRKIRRKKTKSNNSLLFIAGGAVAAILFIAVAIFVLPMLFRGERSNLQAKAVGSRQAASQSGEASSKERDGHAIKLYVPFKKGDRREIQITKKVKASGTIVGMPNPPSEITNAVATHTYHYTTTMKCVLTTAEVDQRGVETAVEVVILQAVADHIQKSSLIPEAASLPSGLVLTLSRNGAMVNWKARADVKIPNFGSFNLGDLLDDSYFGFYAGAADESVGTTERQLVGGTWKINKLDAINKHIATNGYINDVVAGIKVSIIDFPVSDSSGTGKLAKVSKSNGKTWLDLDFGINTTRTKDDKLAVVADMKWNVRTPADASSGPTKKTAKYVIETTSSFEPFPPGSPTKIEPGALLQFVTSIDMTTDIKYGVSEDAIPPRPKGSKKSLER
jgi:hypothetical protein